MAKHMKRLYRPPMTFNHDTAVVTLIHGALEDIMSHFQKFLSL